MNKIFFTSDTHFGHDNVLRMDKRPFANVDEMQEQMIKKWNNKVSPGDIVYVLGDFIWNTRRASDIMKALNGQVILIQGNHDRVDSKMKKHLGGLKDSDFVHIKLEDGRVKECILSHYFMPFYRNHYYGSIHLHGHSHSTKEHSEELRIAKELNEKGFLNEIYNVGCMHWDYEPVTLDEILKKEGKY